MIAQALCTAFILATCVALLTGEHEARGEESLWTLADCQTTALRHSADVNAATARMEAARALASQAGRLRNPEASANALRDEMSFSITQEFDIWGKRSAALRLVESDGAVFNAQRGTVERRLMEDVAQHYWNFARSETLVALLTEETETWQRLLAIRRQEAELGAIAHAHLLEIKEAAADRKQTLLRTRHESDVERAALNVLMARQPGEPLWIELSAPDSSSFPVENVLSAALSTDPTAGEARARAASAGYRIVQEQREWRPNPQFGPTAKEESGEWAAGVELHFSLPVWDRNRDGIRAAEAERERAVADMESAERRAVETAYRRVLDHAMLAEALKCHETEILPFVEERLNGVMRAVETGDGSLLDTLTVQIEWLRRRQEAETLRFDKAEAASMINIMLQAQNPPTDSAERSSGRP